LGNHGLEEPLRSINNISGLVGAGLLFAGISGHCGLARLLAVMPWNKKGAR